ncbi:VOC family protein [Sphingobacterium hungaricum]|nr:hypothetical protein [Sphingobacterium hungaricum]
MRIEELKVLTNKLEAQKEFYKTTLGFELIEESDTQFSIQVGWTYLTFIQSVEPHTYHYCFLIPSNKLEEGLKWFDQRLETVTLEDGGKTVHFDSWNADSFYFYDGAGNIAECIVRHELKNESGTEFNLSDLLCVNEIGIGTSSIPAFDQQLKKEMDVNLWKGDLTRFAAHGSQEGLFLLADYHMKETWFPTQIKIKASPFEAVIKNNNRQYAVEYKNDVLTSREME